MKRTTWLMPVALVRPVGSLLLLLLRLQLRLYFFMRLVASSFPSSRSSLEGAVANVVWALLAAVMSVGGRRVGKR